MSLGDVVPEALNVLHLRDPRRIGHLDPVHEVSGVRGRLHNLGYEAGAGDAMDDDLRELLRLFQKQHGLETGEIDEATQQALEDKHGC
jgi:hypothetical protein